MDNPQYYKRYLDSPFINLCGFKPYYKWITLNTDILEL